MTRYTLINGELVAITIVNGQRVLTAPVDQTFKEPQ